MQIDLTNNQVLQRLTLHSGMRMRALPAEPGTVGGLVPSWEVNGDGALVVDHSYFSAGRTAFHGTELPIAEILNAVQTTIIERQEAAFRMLASVHAEVINSLDEKEIVQNVLREMMRVIPQSDGGVFRLFDEPSGFLIPVSQEGLPQDYKRYLLLPSESVSGTVFVTRQAMVLNSRTDIINAHVVMRPESQSFMERSEIGNALMCAPVVADGRCLGTLTALSFSPESAFSAFDLTLLDSLATQVAVAYQRSVAYQTALATANRLEEMRRDLAAKNEALDRAVTLHETLLKVFSAGSALTAQLDAVAELFDVAFHFENVFGMSHASPGWTADEPDALVQIVRVAETPVGQFCVRPSHDNTFLRALFGTIAAFVALDFVRDISHVDIRNAKRKTHFEMLCAAGELARGKLLHGFRPDRFNQIFVARIPAEEPWQSRNLVLHTLLAKIQKIPLLHNCLPFYQDDQLVCLLSAATTVGLDRAAQAIDDLATEEAVCFGASHVYEPAAQHAQARGIARDCADALLRRGSSGLLHHRDMGVEHLLKGRSKAEILEFANGILMPLISNAEHIALYTTLLTYVTQGKSASKSAGILGIHTNTLYQRLEKIEAIIARKLSDNGDFTLVSLACELLQLYSEVPRASGSAASGKPSPGSVSSRLSC